MNRPIIWVTIDRPHEIALVTGTGSYESMVIEVDPQCRWSRLGHGWVIPLNKVPDLACLADIRFAIYRERDRKS